MNHLPPQRPGKTNVVIGVIVAIVAVAALAVTLIVVKGGSYSGLEPFPVQGYRKSPQNLLGNTYQLDAQVDALLSYEPGVGRLLAVTSDAAPGRLPVFLPEGKAESIHAGQRYSMRVSIRDGGLIYVEELRKF